MMIHLETSQETEEDEVEYQLLTLQRNKIVISQVSINLSPLTHSRQSRKEPNHNQEDGLTSMESL